MHIVIVVSVRPNFIKLAPLLPKLREQFEVTTVHTGQHYDHNMYSVFLEELGLDPPDQNLMVADPSPMIQLAQIIEKFSQLIKDLQPNLVLTIGDNNGSFAATLAAKKLGFPVGHIEAGLRSFDRSQPEEINRLAIDRWADLCFCPTQRCAEHIRGDNAGVQEYFTGDLLLDAFVTYEGLAETEATILDRLEIESSYSLLTLHRANNTIGKDVLQKFVEFIEVIPQTLVLPLHPRTRQALVHHNLMQRLAAQTHVKITDPLGYLEIIKLVKNAQVIITDSNGIQREAYFACKPALVIRPATEFTEGKAEGVMQTIPLEANLQALIDGLDSLVNAQNDIFHPHLFGDGDASTKIVQIIKDSPWKNED